MTKKDLKNGMIIETRNGFKYLYLDEILRGDEKYIYLSSYNNDLTIKNRDFPDFDVVKVYKNESISLKNIFRDEFLEPIWVRQKIVLSEQELEILKALDTLGLKYIVRGSDDRLYVSKEKPIKKLSVWWYDGGNCLQVGSSLFTFITSEDKGYTTIKGILSDFEKENKDFDRQQKC